MRLLWRRLLNLLPGRRSSLEADAREELEALRVMAEPGELGNLALAAENARAEWGWPGVERVARDLGIAFRTLRKNPGYSVACIAILALGIGANTAIFSVIQAVVLKPLPYPNADRMVFLWQKLPTMPEPIGPRMQVPRVIYQEWQRRQDLFEDVAAFQEGPLNEIDTGSRSTLSTAYASVNLFALLGARAAEGRLFRREEEQRGQDRVAVLSDAYFEKRFHRDPAAIDKSIALGHDQFTVIGVLPPKFRVPATHEGGDQKKPDIWLPLSRLWNRPADDTAFQLYVMARLKPRITVDHTRRTLMALQQRLNKSDGERFPFPQTSVFPFTEEDQSKDTSLALYALLGAVGLLLLIGCANLANLTLARAARRGREICIRRALGASRGRIIGQLLTESFLLSTSGAAAGVLLAQLIVQGVLRSHAPVQRPEDIEVNWLVFAFAAAVSLVTTFLFGLAPAITASKVSVNEALKSRGGGGASAAMARSRSALTAAEVGLAVVLLCASGLMMRSFLKLVETGLGFKTEGLAVAEISLPDLRYPDAASRNRFYTPLLARARAIPGVARAALSTTLPLKEMTFTSFRIGGDPKPPMDKLPIADAAEVGDGYFRVMGIPIVQGRDFTDADFARNSAKGEGTVIVNRAFVQKFLTGRNPLGQRLQLDNDRPFEIVGIAENFLAMGGIEPARPQFFVGRTEAAKMLLLLRTAVRPESLADEIRAAILTGDAELPVSKVESMGQMINSAKADIQMVVVLMSAFAGLAVMLAMIGVYSVLTNLVASQTRELGIRMALGATAKSVAWVVVRQSLNPLLIGLVLGLAGGVGLSRVLGSLTEGLVPPDALTFALAALSVLLVAPLAVWGPVRRATSVDCIVALREE